jgi:hypothetical protein
MYTAKNKEQARLERDMTMLKKIDYPDWIHCNYKSLMPSPKKSKKS